MKGKNSAIRDPFQFGQEVELALLDRLFRCFVICCIGSEGIPKVSLSLPVADIHLSMLKEKRTSWHDLLSLNFGNEMAGRKE